MNSNDFYKSKYSKYKNKYLELKQKNLKINQEGGASPETGTFIFFIPKSIINIIYDCQVVIDEKKKLFLQRIGSILTVRLTYEELYYISVLICPINKNDEITPTTDWFIPLEYPNKKYWVKPTKEEKVIEYKDHWRTYQQYFNTAGDFLIKNNIILKNCKYYDRKKKVENPAKPEVFNDHTEVIGLKYTINQHLFNNLDEADDKLTALYMNIKPIPKPKPEPKPELD
jgi:hypothetical protein